MPQFLNLGYAALVDEYVRTGSTLMEALDKTREYSEQPRGVVTAGGNHAVEREPDVAPPPSAETLMLLEGAMKGVGGFSR